MIDISELFVPKPQHNQLIDANELDTDRHENCQILNKYHSYNTIFIIKYVDDVKKNGMKKPTMRLRIMRAVLRSALLDSSA